MAGTALRVDDDDQDEAPGAQGEGAPPASAGRHGRSQERQERQEREESEERELEARPGTSQAIRSSAANKLERLNKVRAVEGRG